MKKFTVLTSVLTLMLFLSLSMKAQNSCVPGNQLSTNITAHTADLIWDGITTPTWVRYYPTGSTTYKYRFANTSNATSLNYLLAETEYTWEINTYCDSAWTGYGWPMSFTTLADTVVCAPTNQLATDVTAHTAILSWEGLTGDSWIRYYPTGTTTYKYKNAHDANTTSLNFLTAETDYTWEISTRCNGYWTAYSWPQTFTTTISTVVCEPTNQVATDVTAHTATLSWEGLSGTTVVRYYPSGTTNYKYRNAFNTNTVALQFLLDETAYTWDMKTFCDGMWTSYSWPQTFTTLIDTVVCEPTNQLASNITAHTVDLSWEGVSGPVTIRYFVTGTTTYKYKRVNSANTVSLHYLADETNYTWEMKVICNGMWTDYGWAQSFTTLVDTVVCEPTNQLAFDITSTTAKLSWEGVTGPTWVRYFVTGTQQYRYRYANLTNAASLSCMLPQTEYTWELNTLCNGFWTGYTSASTFTTLADSTGTMIDSFGANSPKSASIEQEASAVEINVFPNPVSNTAFISFNASIAADYTIRVVNLMGSTVYELSNQSVEGLNSIELNMNDYKNGIYFVVLQQGNEINKIKLIKK